MDSHGSEAAHRKKTLQHAGAEISTATVAKRTKPVAKKENDPGFRRTLKLGSERKKDLQIIKDCTGATTDTAAVNEAIECWAEFAHLERAQIRLAVQLLEEINEVDKSLLPRMVTVATRSSRGSDPKVVARLVVPRL